MSDTASDKSIVHRVFRLLCCYSPQEQELALVDLVQRTGLPKATLHRLAAQLVAVGALERVGKRYRLGLRLFELGSDVWAQRVLRDVAMPYMQELHGMTRECVQLGWLDDGDVLFIDRVRGHDSVRLATLPGGRKPAYCSALGKAMLAFTSHRCLHSVVSRGMTPFSPYTITQPRRLMEQLADVNRSMLAYDREESTLGVACVAAPILDAAGHGVAAISVAAPASRIRGLRVEASVREAGRRITQELRQDRKLPRMPRSA